MIWLLPGLLIGVALGVGLMALLIWRARGERPDDVGAYCDGYLHGVEDARKEWAGR